MGALAGCLGCDWYWWLPHVCNMQSKRNSLGSPYYAIIRHEAIPDAYKSPVDAAATDASDEGRRAGWDDLACKHDVTYKGQDFRDDFHTVELCACCCCCLGTRTAKPEDKSNLPSISLSTTGTNANAHTMSFVGFEMSYVNMLPGISFRTHSFGTFAIHSRQTHCTSD